MTERFSRVQGEPNRKKKKQEKTLPNQIMLAFDLVALKFSSIKKRFYFYFYVSATF